MPVARRPEAQDPRGLVNYTPREAAALLGLVLSTMRSWFLGQPKPQGAGAPGMRMEPVITPAATKPLGLSFWNLVECDVLKSIRRVHGVSMPKVRVALKYVGRRFEWARPLVEGAFLTDGVDLFVARYQELVSASEGGQTVLRDAIEPNLTVVVGRQELRPDRVIHGSELRPQISLREAVQDSLSRVERDSHGRAISLFPWRRNPQEPKVVSIDPRVAFGRPVLAGTGVTVDALVARYTRGEEISDLAADFQVDARFIHGVLRWALASSAA